jgi:hypothetical protein
VRSKAQIVSIAGCLVAGFLEYAIPVEEIRKSALTAAEFDV